MNLRELLHDLVPAPEIEITDLKLCSSAICPQDAFVAIPGTKDDGRRYLQQALDCGAQALICEKKDLAQFHYEQHWPIFAIENLSQKLTLLSRRFYGTFIPQIIGVTGTNGKTTVCYLLAQALNNLGVKSGVIGTLGYGMIGQLKPFSLTTPDIFSLAKYIKELSALSIIAMEVSSHSLSQNRVQNIDFSSAIFTNLTPDHLDYHHDLYTYGQAKQKLFHITKRAILNADCAYSQVIQAVCQVPVTLYSTHLDVLVRATQVTFSEQGLQAYVITPWGEGWLRSTLIGEFNLSNLLAVITELGLRNIPLPDILKALINAKAPVGRMQWLKGTQAVIDYAHTPDALEKVLSAMRSHCQGQLWCVFGCGGNRDKAKRPKMGEIAERLSDRVILTNDNPRDEAPQAIIQDILSGFSAQPIVILDRTQAIHYALAHAALSDMILIAGKGHEDYQIINHQKIPFSDKECVLQFVRNP